MNKLQQNIIIYEVYTFPDAALLFSNSNQRYPRRLEPKRVRTLHRSITKLPTENAEIRSLL